MKKCNIRHIIQRKTRANATLVIKTRVNYTHEVFGKIHANFGTISTDNQLIINL